MSPQIRRSVFFWKNLVAAFLCTIGIFSMAIVFTLHFRPLYYFDIDHLDIPAKSGYSEEVIRRNYDELIDYNSISGPSRLTFSDFMMSEDLFFSGKIWSLLFSVPLAFFPWRSSLPCIFALFIILTSIILIFLPRVVIQRK